MIVFFFSVERTGSLWDCGEFISAAYKMQVVHPPGAPLYLLMARMFAFVGELFFDDPSKIGHAVNLFSGMATAFAAAFIAWSASLLAKLAMVGRKGEPDVAQSIALAGGGIAAGLAAVFATSVWFSAVEGEVYALSTFFTALTIWSTIKWYSLPKDPQNDRWLIFTVFAAALSIGVHLLSLLTFPALALFYYYKKFEKRTLLGGLIAMALGVVLIGLIQSVVIIGIPKMWFFFDRILVNSFGAAPNTGIIPTVLLLATVIILALRFARSTNRPLLHQGILAFMFAIIGYSTIGMVVVRSNANPPINMNEPSDPSRLIPYINREQYGERPLLFGPHYLANPERYDREDRLGLVDGEYEKVSEKISPVYRSRDEMFFPRLGHMDDRRKQLYDYWLGRERGEPTMADNFGFFFKYQIGWMYYRYFMWNFAGRQNGDQGFFPWDKSSGHWESGVSFIDEARLYNMSELPPSKKNNKARNHYYFLPLLFGILGLIWQYRKRRKDFFTMFVLFIITGIGIIVYSNQPPNEPRERDYVLVGSFMTFAIWIGMAVPALFEIIKSRAKMKPILAAGVAGVIVLFAPTIMAVENYDDNSRRYITGARDYANNYLHSLEENAIIFTYGDNDTYPLWYAQEVENIRPDVRIINLSLIAVDWYINQMRRKVNESEPIKMTLSEESIRGDQLNAVALNPNVNQRYALEDILRLLDQSPELARSGRVSNQFELPVDKERAIATGWAPKGLEDSLVDGIPINLNGSMITKDDLAVFDIISSNIYERPIYFASTVQSSKLMGMNDYMQLEGLALRLIPVKSNSNSNMGIYGSGRVAADKILERMRTEYQWGGFDKYDLFVDESYSAAVQAHRMAMMRSLEAFLNRNEYDKAEEICDIYFHAFPNMNFPFISHQVTSFINGYLQAGASEKAQDVLNTLIDQVEDHMIFYRSISEEVISSSFSQDLRVAERTMRESLRLAREISEEYAQEKTKQLAPYR
jgi:hypothetical protein